METNNGRKNILIEVLFGAYLLLGFIVSSFHLYHWMTGKKEMVNL